MKSGKLIETLKELDPSGEIEVCISNSDIELAELNSAFWDGVLQVLIRDHSKDPYYNITGCKYVRTGSKINLYSLSASELLHCHPDADIDYTELNSSDADVIRKYHDTIRKSSRDWEKFHNLELFTDWILQKAKEICPDIDAATNNEIKDVTEDFFEKNFSNGIPLSQTNLNDSATNKRITYFEEHLKVEFNGFWSINLI